MPIPFPDGDINAMDHWIDDFQPDVFRFRNQDLPAEKVLAFFTHCWNVIPPERCLVMEATPGATYGEWSEDALRRRSVENRAEHERREAGHRAALTRIGKACELVHELQGVATGSDFYDDILVEVHERLTLAFGVGYSLSYGRSRPDAEDIEVVIDSRRALAGMGADAPADVLPTVRSAIGYLDGAMDAWGFNPPDHTVANRPHV